MLLRSAQTVLREISFRVSVSHLSPGDSRQIIVWEYNEGCDLIGDPGSSVHEHVCNCVGV